MTLHADLFWSFRSPYSYLATGRIVRLAAEYDLEVAVRPVYPTAMRNPDFFQKVDPKWVAYLQNDVRRLAEMTGTPFVWPSPDPIAMDMQTLAIAPEQPLARRLTRLGVEAAGQGRGLAFIDEVSKLLWNGEVKGWDQGDHLAKATARAGLDLAAMEAKIATDVDAYEDAITANEEALDAAGHWGVPTMVFEGEPFFGQDRLDVFVWRLKQNGLEPRTA